MLRLICLKTLILPFSRIWLDDDVIRDTNESEQDFQRAWEDFRSATEEVYLLQSYFELLSS